ncbi:amino acid ABC transporter permease, partial [Rhizobium sp. BR5]
MASIGPNELFFLLQGLKWTLALTLIGFIGGGIFGLCVALGRVAD